MANNRTGISPILVGYSEILAIVGDIVRVKVPEEENGNGRISSRINQQFTIILCALPACSKT
jgi:hypothetical protein